MGLVVEATNVQLGQKVAVKLLLRGANDPAMAERFGREAQAAARLRSEHVARVFDVGTDATFGPFIVMELLEGRTLTELLATSGRLPLHRAVENVIDACEGLAEAHARGIVHQDVKPGNLFLVDGTDGRPVIKLLDFGIATMRSRGDARSSHPAAGTPAYLAPEQLRGDGSLDRIDHRVDVWALGCVLYELLVGERPFRAPRFTELVTAILESPPHPFPAAADVPAELQAIVLRCLQKNRDRRFSSTGAFALALLPFARRRAHTAVARAVAHVKNAALDPSLQMPSSMPPPPARAPELDLLAGGVPRAPSVPSFDGVLPVEASAPPSPPPAGARRAVLPMTAAAAAVVLVLAAGGAFLAWNRPATSRPEPMPLPSPTFSAAPVTAAVPSSATAAVDPAPPPQVEASASASAKRPVFPVVSPRRPRPPPSTPAAPTSPDSEINRAR
jgi:serine/threonine-protein kinase